MMIKVISCKLLVVSFIIFITYQCFAQPISSVELINNYKNYDGKIVVYRGEVIGEVMARGEYAWINLNDSKNAIGVWIKKDLIKPITFAGTYKTIGDLVEVTGVFSRSCLAHGGDLDIHAQSLRWIKAGNNLEEKLSARRIKIAWGLAVMGIILWISLLLSKPRKFK